MLARQLSTALLALAACSLSCATRGALPPGDELETEEEATRVLDDRGQERVPDSRQPTQDELASAFEEPASVGRPEGTGLTGTGQVAAASPEADPLAPLRAEFEAGEQLLERLLRQRDAPAATSAAEELVRKGQALGPAEQQRALKLAFAAARLAGDDRAAWEAARGWLLSCGPQAVDRCRGAALSALGKVAKAAGGDAQLAKLKKADACVRQAEADARRGTVTDCSSLVRPYPLGDRLMLARATLARGQASLKEEAKVAAGLRDLDRVDDACGEPRCVEVRRKALRLTLEAHLRRGDAEQAARAALRDVKLHAETLEPAQRPYAWTPEAERACAAFEQTAGEGACRKLERSIVGRHSFTDFSRATAGEGLDPERVRAVNTHYRVTFQDCLAQEAARLKPPAQERYTVRWVVLNDGRVGEMHMDRKDQDDSPLARCLRDRLAVWRYPRFAGEYQHVEQTFHVSAVRR